MGKEPIIDLVIKSFRNGLCEDDPQLAAWLSEPRHRTVYNRLHAIWQDAQERAAACEVDELGAWARMESLLARMAPHRSWRVAAALAPIAAMVVMGLFVWFGGAGTPTTMEFTNIHGKAKTVLPDGTEAWLHNTASLHYDSRTRFSQRNVELSGEAFFNVARNERRPFVIEVDGLQIEVVGTSFNVLPDEEEIVVTLVDGCVRLSADGCEVPCEMVAGHAAHYDRRRGDINIVECDTDDVAVWRRERLQFRQKSLAEVCRDLSDWYGREIRVETGKYDDYHYTFTLTGEPLDIVLANMSRVHPIHYECANNGAVRIY